jgi:hypothetical protein
LLPFDPELFVFSTAEQKHKNENTEAHYFSVVLYRWEILFLILKGEHRLWVFEIRELRKNLD